MKRNLLVLALLASSCALYAQQNDSAAVVKAIFEHYNPSVLQRAEQDPAYNAVLQQVIYSTPTDGTLENHWEVAALAKNFDNSIRLSALAQEYEDALIMAAASGNAVEPTAQKYRAELTQVYSRIWAVSVNMQEELLARYKKILKQTGKDPSFSKEQRDEQKKEIQGRMDKTKAYLKQLKGNAGEYITSAVDSVMMSAENNAAMTLALTQARSQMQAAQAVEEVQNLQIKNNNQKRVAK